MTALRNPQPGQPIGTPTPNKFPQWGVGNPDGNLNSAGDVIAEAKNAAQKTQLANQGYLVWFATKAAAQDFISSETSALNGNLPNPISGVTQFLGRLSQASTWVRVAEILIGAALIIVAVAKLASGTQAGRSAAKVATTAALL